MTRNVLSICGLAIALAPVTASAEPGVLYIPTDPVTLRPTGVAPCTSSVNSALGCGGAGSEAVEPPFVDAADLAVSMSEALSAYDVHVTNTRPPGYIAYTMMLAREEPIATSQSFTCAFGGINCASRQRNDIVSTSGDTENCTDPDVVHAAMYAFGRNSGLEGIANPNDWMNYPPDYTTLPMDFVDACADRLNQFGFNDRGLQISLPLECTSIDHVECPHDENGDRGQNGHEDLLRYYGAHVEDTDAPVLTNITPDDGAVLPEGSDLVLDVDIADADPVVGARWTLQSDAIVSDTFPDGIVSQCTNDVCFVNWDDATPLKATDSDWSMPLSGLPNGDYAITLEASDFHGNVAATVSFTVTIGGASSDETGGNDDATAGGNDDTTGGSGGGTVGGGGNEDTDGGGDNGDTNGGGGTSGSTSDGDSSSGSAAVVEDRGCTCQASRKRGGLAFMLLGLLGVGAVRRRPRSGSAQV